MWRFMAACGLLFTPTSVIMSAADHLIPSNVCSVFFEMRTSDFDTLKATQTQVIRYVTTFYKAFQLCKEGHLKPICFNVNCNQYHYQCYTGLMLMQQISDCWQVLWQILYLLIHYTLLSDNNWSTGCPRIGLWAEPPSCELRIQMYWHLDILNHCTKTVTLYLRV